MQGEDTISTLHLMYINSYNEKKSYKEVEKI